ncbi:MAG: efflux RND transporter periplasmic adaptor subunit [Methyloligellaceae bacterium]
MPQEKDAQHNQSAGAGTASGGKKRTPTSPYIWAILFALAIGGWMLSKTVINTIAGSADVEDKKEVKGNGALDKKKLFHVEIQTFTSRQRRANLIIRGRTEVDARVSVKAETAGVVEEVPMQKGKWVKTGDLLCRLQTGDRNAALLQAKAKLAEAEADYSANIALAKKGHTAQLKVTSVKAQLDAARAELKKAQLNLERTMIRAPFDGFVEEQPAKVGDYLNIASSCATLVSLNPLKVVGTVSEIEVPNLHHGMTASVKLISGQVSQGKIRFISSSAEEKTRTFRIELEIENKDAKIRDGLTADIDIPLKLTKAHLFSPAILVLDADGKIGVRTVGDDSRVIFKTVKILSDSPDGIWVAGLPDKVRVITAGQEYVVQGQAVRASEKKEATQITSGQDS